FVRTSAPWSRLVIVPGDGSLKPSPSRSSVVEALRCRAGSTAVAFLRVAGAPRSRRREVLPPGTGQESASPSMAQHSPPDRQADNCSTYHRRGEDHGPRKPSGSGDKLS